MDNRYSAYGIGQRRQPNEASSSFAPIRSGGNGGGNIGNGGGGGGGAVDNFRGPLSMNYGRSDSFNNGGYNNQQRFADNNDGSKFSSVQSMNNFGNFTNNNSGNKRFSSNSNPVNVASIKNNNYEDRFSQPNFLGRSLDQRFGISDNSNNRKPQVQNDFMPDNFRGQQMPTNVGQMTRSVSDLGYNKNSGNSNNNNQNDNNQRFYNNDRIVDSYQRVENFNSDNFRSGGGQDSNQMSRPGGNYKLNIERSAPRSNNAGNFGINDFRGSQPNFVNNKNNHSNNISNNNNNNQAYFNNVQPNNPGNNNVQQNYRGQGNPGPGSGSGPTGNALAVLETVNALMLKNQNQNQNNWQVGNNGNIGNNGSNGNYGFNQGGIKHPNLNQGGNRNIPWQNDNNSGPKQNRPNTAQVGNRQPQLPINPTRATRQVNNNINNNNNNRPQQAPVFNARKPPVGVTKFPGNNKPQQQQQHQQQQQQQQQQQKKPIINNQANIKNNKQANNQAVVKNVNGGKPKPGPAPTQVPSKANVAVTQNTQAKTANKITNKPSDVKKAPADAKPKDIKRSAEVALVPQTKADIKRRKLAVKRGFLVGGFKLPYVQSTTKVLPQPEDKSYAIMFFEQSPNYSTSGEELDEEALADDQESEHDGKNAGRTLVKRIRKRLHYEWTQMEEAKKYKSWQTWWTDYKWCEVAIKEQLDTFDAINLRNFFLPDLPRLSTEQVVDVIVQQAQFGLEKNSDNYFHNMKSIFTLMNVTFLENLKMPNTEKVQDLIRAVPNEFWTYKMRSMVYLWAQYLKISKTSSPSTEIGAKELQAIERDWKNPLFHWVAKQAFDELKAISEVEWPEHKQQYATVESSAPTS